MDIELGIQNVARTVTFSTEESAEAVNTAIARRAVTEDLAAQMTDARTVGCTEFGELITKLL